MLTNAAVAVAAAVLRPLGHVRRVRVGKDHEMDHLTAQESSRVGLVKNTCCNRCSERSHCLHDGQISKVASPGNCSTRWGVLPANPEPGTSVGQLLVRAGLVDLKAQDTLVECKGKLQVLNQKPNMVHSLVVHAICDGCKRSCSVCGRMRRVALGLSGSNSREYYEHHQW